MCDPKIPIRKVLGRKTFSLWRNLFRAGLALCCRRETMVELEWEKQEKMVYFLLVSIKKSRFW